jgi:hypothetical protein
VKTSWETKIFAKIFEKTKIFTKQNFAKFCENLLIFASFFLFVKMEKNVFVSTLVHILALVPATQQKRQGPSIEGGARSKTLQKNANFFTPHLTFWGPTFVVVFFYSF